MVLVFYFSTGKYTLSTIHKWGTAKVHPSSCWCLHRFWAVSALWHSTVFASKLRISQLWSWKVATTRGRLTACLLACRCIVPGSGCDRCLGARSLAQFANAHLLDLFCCGAEAAAGHSLLIKWPDENWAERRAPLRRPRGQRTPKSTKSAIELATIAK